MSLGTQVVVLHVQGAVTGLHVLAWQAYVARHLGARPGRLDQAITLVLLLIAALWLVPGFMFRSVPTEVSVPWLGITYRFPEILWTGSLGLAAAAAVLVLVMVRHLRAMGLRTAAGRVHALALGAIIGSAFHDIVVTSKHLQSPLLLAVAFVAAVGVLGWDLTRAFVASARELDNLSRRLEQRVEECCATG